MTDDQLGVRLRRLEQQIRAFKQLHVREVGDLAEKLQLVLQLVEDELQLVLDELETITRDAASVSTAEPAADPAAGSPKRAKWLAEQERRKAPVSRRELLLRRGEDPKP
jgi:hypothetical protein